MTNFTNFSALLVLAASLAFGQRYTVVQTSLSAAVGATDQVVRVASATSITTSPATALYIDNEFMYVLAVSGTNITVTRGSSGTRAVPHISGAMVLHTRPEAFQVTAPTGACTTASTLVTPWIDITTGLQYLCSTVSLKWGPGFGNPQKATVSTAVASAAGVVLPTGPLFHITGALAITGFTIPVGFEQGGFCVVPDGTFTWTAAGNIGLAGTAVVGKTLCFVYDTNTSKFYPSYIA